MEGSAEVSSLSYIDVLLKSLDKSLEADRARGLNETRSGLHETRSGLHETRSGPQESRSGPQEARSGQEQDAVPDSTTSHTPAPALNCGDDVLVPRHDGKYYLGSIIELSSPFDAESRCLIKFGDGTRSWAATGDVKLLSAPPPDDGRVMCVVCKRREGAGQGAGVVPCDTCGRGYHHKCHTPVIDTYIHGASWNCKRCVEQRYRAAAAENRAQKRSTLRLDRSLQQPCDTASTTSSTASEHGKEEHCYCGEKSDWLAQMLMCCRCSRWFHQRCVSSLQYPLYAGDKMYIFSCSACNGGSEYLRRLELRWLDLAHLALYNLTAYNARNYFDLDAVIMPYIMDNWHALQLPQKMWCTSAEERREKVLGALTGSRARFKSGREMKKRATIWGLRVRKPPPHPAHLNLFTQLKEGEPLTDSLVCRLAPRLHFLPRARSISPTHTDSLHPTSTGNGTSSYAKQNQNMIVPVDGHWLNLMMGKRFHQNLASNDTENDSPCSSPSPIEFMNNTITNHSVGLRYDMLKMNDVNADTQYTFDEESDVPQADKHAKNKQLKLYKYDYQNGNFVKKSVPLAKHAQESSEQKKKKVKTKQRNGSVNNIKQLRSTTKEKVDRATTPIRSFAAFSRSPERDKDRSPSADPEIILKGDCSSFNDSAKRLDAHCTAPVRSSSPLSHHSLENSSEMIRQRKLSSCTSDQSMQAESRDSSDKSEKTEVLAHTSKVISMNLELSKMSTTNTIEHSKIMSLQQSTPEPSRRVSLDSCTDDTLSRSTLDSIIPPPKDFQGKNNPFLLFNGGSRSGLSMASRLVSKNGGEVTRGRSSLPAQPSAPPVRTIKRQLSEKDLIIGPNGEVKRRKVRRSRKNGQLNHSCPLPGDSGKTSQIYPRQEEAQKNVFNSRQLRKRQERSYVESGRRGAGAGAALTARDAVSSLHLSPRKDELARALPDTDFTSLKSYFGALTRMRDGSDFRVLARRTTPGGDAQYLVEWASAEPR